MTIVTVSVHMIERRSRSVRGSERRSRESTQRDARIDNPKILSARLKLTETARAGASRNVLLWLRRCVRCAPGKSALYK